MNAQPDIWIVLWSGRYVVLLSFVIASGASVVAALLQPDIYRAEALVAPQSEDQNAIPNMLGQFREVAALAGFQLQNNAVDRATLAIETIRSRKFLNDFVAKRELAPMLFAIDGWEKSTNMIHWNRSIYDPDTQKWTRAVGPPMTPIPDIWEVYERVSSILTVQRDPDTGLVLIAVEFLSPYLARQWVEWLIDDLNEEMRERDKIESQKSIDYLQRQLDETSVAGIRQVFFELIENQMRTLMLSEVRDEYSFAIIDPPITSQRKVRPNRTVICILGGSFGLFLGCTLVLLMAAFKREPLGR